jgi:hypothetical protein
MTMKRWIWILAMVPVMWGLLQLVISADRLYAYLYSDGFAPPTPADYARAAVTFWGALLTPVLVGLGAAVVAFRRKYPPRWPFLEMAIVAFPYLGFAAGSLGGFLYKSNSAGHACWYAMMGAYLVVGGAVVVSLLNLGACVRQREWGKFALSSVVLCAGMLYLLWLNAFIIYIDT